MLNQPLKKSLALTLLLATTTAFTAPKAHAIMFIAAKDFVIPVGQHMVAEIDDEHKIATALSNRLAMAATVGMVSCMVLGLVGVIGPGTAMVCVLGDSAPAQGDLDQTFFAKNGYSAEEQTVIGREARRFIEALDGRDFSLEKYDDRAALHAAMVSVLPDVSETYVGFVADYYGVR